MRKFSWHILSLLGLVFFLLSSTTVLAAEPVKSQNYQDFSAWYLAKYNFNELPYRAAAVIETGSFTPLYFHQENTVIPTASLIKLVTAGTVVNYNVDWWQKTSFSQADNEDDLRQYVDPKDTFSLLKLAKGDSVSVEQSFASMLIGSANNSANNFSYLITERASFIEKMRQVAKNWGMVRTIIEEPTGLSLNNTSTAADLAQGTCHALENFIIQYYSSKPNASFVTSAGEKKTVQHTVYKLRSNPQRFFGAKTGYLRETGFHLSAGFITPQGKRICATILSTKDRATSESVLYDLGKWVDEMYSW
ncbi:MAG: serine hydrolase [Patescibacteria group bacterium]